MRKKHLCLLAATLACIFVLTACGAGGTQEISFQGFKMEIPKAWKVDKHSLDEDYAIYEKLNKTGHDYRQLLSNTYGLLPKCEGSIEEAGEFFKEVSEDNKSYSDVSNPVAGKFAGEYDMHVIDCIYHALNPMEADGESDYPCKLVRIYMGDHDVKIEFIAAKGDFEAFNAAIQNAERQ